MVYLWGILAAVISFALCLWTRNLALKKKLALAEIRDRDIHAKPIPRLGGVAIVLTFLVVMIAIAFFAPKSWTDFGFPFAVLGVPIDKRLLGILLATVFISAVMLKDDLKGVPAYGKFLAQIFAGLILVFAGIGIVSLNNPFGNTIFLDSIKWPIKIGADTYHIVFWADLLLLIWVGLLMNATNFIDGLDGLAGGLGFIAAIILAFVSLREHQAATALMAAIFAGSIGGFLLLNVPPAKIFLGDVGSMFIGLMLAALTLISGGKLATLLLVFGLVILDALYVIARRLIRGKNPMTTPDQTHIHHRFLRAGISATSTLILLLGFSVIFGLIGLIFVGRLKLILLAVMAVISVGMFVVLDLKARTKLKDEG